MINIDTLHIQTTATIPKEHLHAMAMNGNWNTYHKGRGYDRYQAKIGNVMIKHTVQNHNTQIEIDSCAAFLHGNGMASFLDEQLPQFYGKLQQLLVEELGVELFAPLSDSLVTRLDVKKDFYVGDEMDDYLSIALEHAVPYHEKGTEGNGNTIYYKNSSRKMKIYNRYANCVRKKKSAEETEMSKGMLRFEVVCNPAELNRQLDLNTPQLESVLHSRVTDELMGKYLQLLNLLDMRVSTERELREELKRIYGRSKAENMLNYIKARQEGRIKDFPRSTRSDYERRLKELGRTPVIGTKCLRPLGIEGTLGQEEYPVTNLDSLKTSRGTRINTPSVLSYSGYMNAKDIIITDGGRISSRINTHTGCISQQQLMVRTGSI